MNDAGVIQTQGFYTWKANADEDAQKRCLAKIVLLTTILIFQLLLLWPFATQTGGHAALAHSCRGSSRPLEVNG